MSSVFRVATHHRSIRKYKSDPIPEELMNRVLEAGLRSSTSGNMQTWSAIVTTDRSLRRELYALHREQDMILQAPCVITFCADFHRMRRWVRIRKAASSFDDLVGFLTAAFDAVIAAQSSALVAEESNLGVCYMGTTLWAMGSIADLLECPSHVVPVTSLVMGYPDEDPSLRHRLDLKNFIHAEKYRSPTDAEIIEMHKEKEITGWERIQGFPGVKEDLKRLGIQDLANYYTSEIKYSKKTFSEASMHIFETLKKRGFWEF